MEKQKEKIMKFSKVIFILLKIAYIMFIVAGVFGAAAFLWSVMKINTEIINIAGVEMELPLLFKLGNFKVFWPVMWKRGFDLPGISFVSEFGAGNLIQIIITIFGIRRTADVFKLLRENGSPFRSDVAVSLKRLTIALIVMGVVSGAVPFLAAGITWVLYLIFDYGRALQNESDTTL